MNVLRQSNGKHLFSVFALCLMLIASVQCARSQGDIDDYDGIDVSHHQKNIDWAKVAKDTKIQFVYIKATEGATYVDDKYKENVKNARANGLKIGSYHYFRMTSTPKEQFENFKRNVLPDEQDLIPMVDVENCGKSSKSEVQKNLTELLKLLKDYYGAEPIIYGTQRSYNTWLAPKFNDHFLYIGKYNNKTEAPELKGNGKYSVWQYSQEGTIDGIPKAVDLCKFNTGCTLDDILLKKD